jgi:ribosomal protein S18 acetylase RimI-like enzyme
MKGLSMDKVKIRPTRLDDIASLRVMHVRSWRETYPNEALGVSAEWVEDRTAIWLTPEGQEHSKNIYDNPNHFHQVATLDDEIIGMVHVSKTKHGQHFEALYIDKNQYGSGLAKQLMEKALAWHDVTQPIDLEVATYNERAKAFYRKYGFKEKIGSEHLFAEKIPVVVMEKEGEKR